MKGTLKRNTILILLFILYINNTHAAYIIGDWKRRPSNSNLSLLSTIQTCLTIISTLKICYDMFKEDYIYDFKNKKFKSFLSRNTFDFTLDLIMTITSASYLITLFFTSDDWKVKTSSLALTIEILIKSIKIPIWMIVDKHFNPYKTIGVVFGIISAFVIFTQSKQ